jgi:hypothetical protein
MAIVFDVCDSWHITQKKKIEKIMWCLTIKSPLLSYRSGFVFKWKDYYVHCICCSKNEKNNWMDFQPKKLKLWNGLRFHLCKSISFNTKKKSKIPPTTLILKYICKFSNSMVGIILS